MTYRADVAASLTEPVPKIDNCLVYCYSLQIICIKAFRVDVICCLRLLLQLIECNTLCLNLFFSLPVVGLPGSLLSAG